MKRKILVTFPMEQEARRRLCALDPEAEFLFLPHQAVTEETLSSVEVLLGNVMPSLLSNANSLRWMQLQSAGSESYIAEGVLPEGVVLTNATGAYGPAVGEHFLAMLLAFYKKLHLYRDHQKQNEWSDEGEARTILNTQVLIVGAGDIGLNFARTVKALGAYTIGVKRTASEKPDSLDELYTIDQLDRLLPAADVVALVLPSTPDTIGMFGAERIGRMKDGAVLLNCGRGTAVDTNALCTALASGKLSGAGLDVTDPEPLPIDHPLWKQKNAIITPHVAGGDRLGDTSERIIDLFVENLQAYLAGKPLKNVVSRERRY